MRLRNPVLGGGIAGLALLGADLAAAGDASFKLRSYFVASSSFERIRAAE
jgi:hypothetical protein